MTGVWRTTPRRRYGHGRRDADRHDCGRVLGRLQARAQARASGRSAGFDTRRPEDPDRRADQGLRPQGAAQALHSATRSSCTPTAIPGSRRRRPTRPSSRPACEVPFQDPYRVACIIGSGAGGLVTIESCLSRPVHQQQARHPSADAAAHHRLVGGGACRHRVRRQGPDVCHLQRLLDGGARHRHRPRLHPPRPGRYRHRRRLRERDQLRHDEGLAGDARAVARGLLPVRQEAQRHGAGRGRRHPGAGVAGARQGARRQDPGGALRASA